MSLSQIAALFGVGALVGLAWSVVRRGQTIQNLRSELEQKKVELETNEAKIEAKMATAGYFGLLDKYADVRKKLGLHRPDSGNKPNGDGTTP